MVDEQFTVYFLWTKDGYTNTEEVSAFGGVSSNEDDESDDFFSDDYSSVKGYISIKGDLFTAAFSRLPVLAVRPNSTTTDVDEHDNRYGGTYCNIFFRCIEDLYDMTFELRLFFDIIE
ncbi:hypothetical protein CC86DRAFT_411614 [Ophiobolus disseminans]|uniref:Uncharacterized protein n=1 Tax=Ophiobolus disseminans TaxID=1469910 RepID=A0A6A6ZI41_9PLEO|nr:hypothetical protein CC86DRAFT_411614 [Ophiobolus disseminans]